MKRVIPGFLLLIFCTLIFSGVPEDFDIQGHRGCRGLMPQNTLAGFKYAMEKIGVDTLEMDVVITRDKVLVLNHDPYLNTDRTMKDGEFLDERIYIKDLTLDEIKEYEVGQIKNRYLFPFQAQLEGVRIPTLQEVIDLVKEWEKESGEIVRLNIETKISPINPKETFSAEVYEALLLELIDENDIRDQVTVQSFYWKIIMDVKEKHPDIDTAALISSHRMGNPIWFNGLKRSDYESFGAFIQASNADILSMNYQDLKPEYISELQERGIRVIPYTINKRRVMRRFIELGVDGIITDYPNLLKKVIAEMSD